MRRGYMTLETVTASLAYLRIMKIYPPRNVAFDEDRGFHILTWVNSSLKG
jgi:hypothetical protein